MNLTEDTKLRIHLIIGGFRIPMMIDREDEEIYRKAEKQVNKYLEEYQKLYTRSSGEEIWTLIALRLAVVIFKMEANEDIEPVIERIQSLDEELKLLFNQK